jgi:hypothetical protein
MKYTCPGGGLNAWAKPNIVLVCGACHTALDTHLLLLVLFALVLRCLSALVTLIDILHHVGRRRVVVRVVRGHELAVDLRGPL